MVRWLVTGTGTGVGKTIVSAALCRLLLDDDGGLVTYAKPAQSGAATGDDDASAVAALVADPDRLRTVVGARLAAPLAPSVAARDEGVAITRDRLLATIPTADAGPVVVEGAGGLLVELGTDGTTAADLAAATGLELVVVARPDLGTLNDTLLTIEAARARGLVVRGVVVSGLAVPPPDRATGTNPAELHRLTGGLLAGLVPLLADPPAPLPPGSATAWFAPCLSGRLDVDGALRAVEAVTPAPLAVAPRHDQRRQRGQRGSWRRG